MIVNGFVEKTQEYPSKYQDKFGKPKPSMWAMYVDNTRYSLKNVKPPAEGTNISFEAMQDEKGYWNLSGPVTVNAAGSAAAAEVPIKDAVPTPAGMPSFPRDTRQDSIIYQSSRKDAIEFVNMLLSKELLDFGKARGAQKIELVEIYVDNYTQRFIDDVKRLAPPEHGSPAGAESADNVTSVAKPAKKAKPAEEADEFDDDIPF